jgi:glyoxylase-like metal-dependent hydrolase (beta-lactamase superfamily II)
VSEQTYNFKIGEIECIAIRDFGSITQITEEYYPNTTGEEIRQSISKLGYDAEKFPTACIPLLIKAGDKTILIDAGNDQTEDGESGRLLVNLRAEGIAPEEIDIVVITHGHSDHFDGLVDTNGDLTYPNAQYITWKSEWDYWMGDPPSIEQFGAEYILLMKMKMMPIEDKLTLLEEETEIAPGVHLVIMAGHTPGQCGVLVESDGEKLLAMADAAHKPMQLQHPEWHFAADVDGDAAAHTRHELFRRAAEEKLLVHFYHFPFPGLGHVVADGDAWKWQPLE